MNRCTWAWLDSIYYELSGDSGSGAVLGDFKSRVYSVGPQAGFFFPDG